MQIDFHHAVTYVCCRLAGMDDAGAAVVAHAAQYVDDATNDGPLQFATGERYVRVTSAHQTLDLRLNSDAADNRMVWVPFHFLPGNDAVAPGTDADEAFIRRMVCRPNSQVAQEMVFDCIERQDKVFALHRLGVALHTYVDTWAHQGFVGMVNDFNKVDAIQVQPDPAYRNTEVYADLTSGATRAKAFVAGHLPVGHASVLTFPDLPFLRWSFTRDNGEKVVRDNPGDFLVAAQNMFDMARRYVARDRNLASADLPAADRQAIDTLLRNTIALEGEERHKAWAEAIAQGRFSFGPTQVDYIDSGPGSWKFQAVGQDPDVEDGSERFDFTPAFLTSHWKRFHDAVQHHRLFILHELLPRHGLSAS
ncbi:hypothetical protein HHL11_12655 [Ramlibacter sp. G-1-2-2]|uniref:Uncharacterized protein n=1 Tax=Ramlibacter agri TaxID=2728837 RepID=A0A848HAG3_9BURK|nr:DUF6765 family protein [Ramlibacter agri]NML44608.1 hypothetical protein [Ramlibacter agri]